MKQETTSTNGYTVKSWLLTLDHVIALLYLLSITFFHQASPPS
jgi:hypothetical protein